MPMPASAGARTKGLDGVLRKPRATDADYEAIKARAAARSRVLSEAGRDIGALPAVTEHRRKGEGELNFQTFCLRYMLEIIDLCIFNATNV